MSIEGNWSRKGEIDLLIRLPKRYPPRGELVRRGGGWEAAVLTLTMISLEELLGQLLKMVCCSPS